MMNDSNLDAILKKMAAEHRPQLPSSGLIWFRAQLLRKTQQKERIERPLVFMRFLAALAAAMILLAFVTANWGEFQDAMNHVSRFLLPLLLLTVIGSLAFAAMLLWSPAKH